MFITAGSEPHNVEITQGLEVLRRGNHYIGSGERCS